MLQTHQLQQSEATSIVSDSTEKLRQILTDRQHRNVSYDEASEISDALIEFYETLAKEETDESAV